MGQCQAHCSTARAFHHPGGGIRWWPNLLLVAFGALTFWAFGDCFFNLVLPRGSYHPPIIATVIDEPEFSLLFLAKSVQVSDVPPDNESSLSLLDQRNFTGKKVIGQENGNLYLEISGKQLRAAVAFVERFLDETPEVITWLSFRMHFNPSLRHLHSQF